MPTAIAPTMKYVSDYYLKILDKEIEVTKQVRALSIDPSS